MKIKGENMNQRVMRETRMKVQECRCRYCREQCKTPCIGTPSDIQKLIEHGYKDKLEICENTAGIVLGLTDKTTTIVAPKRTESGACIFFNEEKLCDLHSLGLKPLEGKLSFHTTMVEKKFIPKRSISWSILKEWEDPENKQIVEQILKEMKK